jgi:spermidine synthase
VGDTVHGAEVLGQSPPEPIGYHDRTGPFGQLYDELLPSDATNSPVAVLGLGAGVMACYAHPGQQWTFYEIDPLVERIARNTNLFTYLSDCPGQHNVVLGDARLKIAEAPDNEYGMIVGEAFSSDAIPVHLTTREAVDLYLRKLKSDGVLVMDISNRHLMLEPVVGDLAQDRGLVCYAQLDTQTEGIPHKLASHFTVLARNTEDLGGVPNDPRWRPCRSNPDPSQSVWTDDFSNLVSTFAWN